MLGGEMRREANWRRRTREETVDAIDARLAAGVKPMRAYRQVAAEQGVGEQTIRKEYAAAKKAR
jgi:predicted transcriptional regulator